MLRRWWAWAVDRARTSLFLLPMLAVVAAVAAAAGLVALDASIDDASSLPLVFSSTVDSARAVLTTLAAATISFAGIAFSVSLLVIQRTSAQYSPRVVDTLFRDPFNGRVMAMVIGTFTFCVVVLRSVRSPAAESTEAVVPNVSVSVALLLGIGAILAIIAFIDHSARSMDVSQILERVTRNSLEQMEVALPELAGPDGPGAATADGVERGAVHHVVRVPASGWVQRVGIDALLDCTPPNGGMVLHTAPGRYAVPGAPLCSVWGSVADIGELDRRVFAAISLGSSRTLQQDPSYGVRQTVDVALRALSPGVNDPTTAQDAIFHIAALLVALLGRDHAPQVHRTEAGGVLLLPELPRHDELVDLAYDELRRAAAPHPTVCVYLLESMSEVRRSVELDGHPNGLDRLAHQAQLVVAGCAAADLIEEDVDAVRIAFGHRFRDRSAQVDGGTS